MGIYEVLFQHQRIDSLLGIDDVCVSIEVEVVSVQVSNGDISGHEVLASTFGPVPCLVIPVARRYMCRGDCQVPRLSIRHRLSVRRQDQRTCAWSRFSDASWLRVVVSVNAMSECSPPHLR